MTRTKAYFTVEVELDPVSGAFDTVDSACEYVQASLSDSIGHYNPVVVPLTAANKLTADIHDTDSPYMKGYREGRSGDTGSVDNAWTSRQKASYSLGYAYGVDDRTVSLKEKANV